MVVLVGESLFIFVQARHHFLFFLLFFLVPLEIFLFELCIFLCFFRRTLHFFLLQVHTRAFWWLTLRALVLNAFGSLSNFKWLEFWFTLHYLLICFSWCMDKTMFIIWFLHIFWWLFDETWTLLLCQTFFIFAAIDLGWRVSHFHTWFLRFVDWSNMMGFVDGNIGLKLIYLLKPFFFAFSIDLFPMIFFLFFFMTDFSKLWLNPLIIIIFHFRLIVVWVTLNDMSQVFSRTRNKSSSYIDCT